MVTNQRLASDTPQDVEDQQVALWRTMSTLEKARLISQLSASARAMTTAGVRSRYPDAGDREVFLRVAFVTLGRDLACRVYPDALSLDD
jgi:hypothetical protein